MPVTFARRLLPMLPAILLSLTWAWLTSGWAFSTPYKMLRLVLHMIALSVAIMLAHVRQHFLNPDIAGNLKLTVILFWQV